MEMKHTPGPWIFWRDRNNRLQIGQSTNYTVAEMCITPLHGQDANAALIAAAPELLDALRLCYDHCRLYYPEVEHNNVGKSVRAAIAKATGEAA